MARRSLSAKESLEDDVNMTPLLDIVFIMLIFFIVTSTFIKEPGIDVVRPEVATGSQLKSIGILVAISDTGEIWINNEKIELSQVRQKIVQLRRETPQGGAVLQADVKSRSKLMIDVLQEIKSADITDIAVATTQL